MSHGPQCGGKKTASFKCKFCGTYVFLYTCDHGSRVLFNERKKQKQWQKHACSGQYFRENQNVLFPSTRNAIAAQQNTIARMSELKSQKPDLLQFNSQISIIIGIVQKTEMMFPELLQLDSYRLERNEYDYLTNALCVDKQCVTVQVTSYGQGLSDIVKVIIRKSDRIPKVGDRIAYTVMQLLIKHSESNFHLKENLLN